MMKQRMLETLFVQFAQRAELRPYFEVIVPLTIDVEHDGKENGMAKRLGKSRLGRRDDVWTTRTSAKHLMNFAQHVLDFQNRHQEFHRTD
jgi:hypothetical protein